MIYLICGKICSGKSCYSKTLREQHNAVIFSTDEATFDLIKNEQGEFYDVFAQRVNAYLRKKAAETAKAGANVILDWGFWTKADRERISSFLTKEDVPYEWHYIDIDDTVWQKNIAARNRRIEEGNGGSDFYVDDGLLQKLLSMFETPGRDEIDTCVKVTESDGRYTYEVI